MKRIIYFVLMTFLTMFNTWAGDLDDFSFKASAPQVVQMGQQFRLEFSITNAKPNDFQAPDLSNFQVLMGPSVSSAKSVSITNGNMVTSENVSYTYVLTPSKEGTFTISPARFTQNGKTVMSNALTIKVVAQSSSSLSSAQTNGNNQSSSNNVNISDNDIFCLIEYNKQCVYEQEQIVASIKLYHKGNVVGLDNIKFPEYNGFMTQEINLKEEERTGTETYKGQKYATYLLKKYILFPQKTGKIEIENGKLTATAQVHVSPSNRRRSIFDMDDFFGRTYNVKKELTIKGKSIEVKPLPTQNKPEDFINAVGSYRIETSINSTEVKANDPITVKVKITGTGNIKYIKEPAIEFPNDFEIYDPKVDTKISTASGIVSGTKEIEYLAIPRYAGTYELPSKTFSFFDPKTKKYTTLRTQAYTLTVAKSDTPSSENTTVVSNFGTKENVKYLGKDIRFINTNNTTIQSTTQPFFGTTKYFLWFIIPLCIFTTLFILYRKQLKENANITLVKNKRANKQATKRLKKAQQYLQGNQKEAFYEEVLKALWGYTSDKLNIPISDLNKDNIESKLTEHQVQPEVINQFMDILQTCEFARFAPVEGHEAMDQLYDKAVELISVFEEQIKK